MQHFKKLILVLLFSSYSEMVLASSLEGIQRHSIEKPKITIINAEPQEIADDLVSTTIQKLISMTSFFIEAVKNKFGATYLANFSEWNRLTSKQHDFPIHNYQLKEIINQLENWISILSKTYIEENPSYEINTAEEPLTQAKIFMVTLFSNIFQSSHNLDTISQEEFNYLLMERISYSDENTTEEILFSNIFRHAKDVQEQLVIAVEALSL